jgi:penicillin amidase
MLRVSPEPWTPADSVAGLKMMAWDLGGNWRNELLRMQLSKTLPISRIQEFLPPYPGDPPVELPDLKALYGPLEREPAQISGSDPDFSGGLGSNSWVVSGSRSVTGKPLLANDPHLGLTAPSVWYLAHLHAPGIDAIGGTLPGVPGILIGRTERVAWGFTNTGPDVQDLYLEKLDAAGNYLTPDGARPFEVIEETIKVRGREDERHRVRISRHGPVISDVSRTALEATPRGHVLAFAWTALAEDDLTLQAALKLSRVRDWASFVEVGRDLHVPHRARPRSNPQATERPERPCARAGLGRTLRLGRLHSLRRAAARLQSAQRIPRQLEPEDRSRGLPASHHQRMGAPLSCAARHPAAASYSNTHC